jgi:hypothetical protein
VRRFICHRICDLDCKCLKMVNWAANTNAVF